MASLVSGERRAFVTASVCMAALVAFVAPAAAQKDNAYVQHNLVSDTLTRDAIDVLPCVGMRPHQPPCAQVPSRQPAPHL